NAVEVQAKVAARARSQPCSIFTTIISMAMIASSTSNPSAMMRAPSVMRWRSRPVAYITSSTIASTRRHRQRHHDAGTPAERQEAHDQHDDERFGECLDEFRNRLANDVGLISNLGDFDPERKLVDHGFDFSQKGFGSEILIIHVPLSEDRNKIHVPLSEDRNKGILLGG